MRVFVLSIILLFAQALLASSPGDSIQTERWTLSPSQIQLFLRNGYGLDVTDVKIFRNWNSFLVDAMSVGTYPGYVRGVSFEVVIGNARTSAECQLILNHRGDDSILVHGCSGNFPAVEGALAGYATAR